MHFCKDCQHFALGYCVFHKANIRGRTFSECPNFIRATNKESDASARDRRRAAEKIVKQVKINSDLSKKLSIRKVERERSEKKKELQAIKRRETQDNERKQRQQNETQWENPNRILKAIQDMKLSLAKEQLKTLEKSQPVKEPKKNSAKKNTQRRSTTKAQPVENNLVNHQQSKEKDVIKKVNKNKIYALSVQDEAFLDRYIEVEKERNILREKLERMEEMIQFDQKEEELYELYKEAIMDRDRYKEKLEHTKHELMDAMSQMRSFPTSDITAQRVFINYIFNLLKFCQQDNK